jgi:toxin secretion/phage lysis holin
MQYVKYALTVVVSGTAYLVGGWDRAMIILLTLIIIDYVTGLIRAAMKGELDSKVGARGIMKKVCMFVVVAVAVQIELFVGQPESLHNIVCYFYVVNEAISILENVGDYVPIPEELKRFINRLKDKDERVKDRLNNIKKEME